MLDEQVSLPRPTAPTPAGPKPTTHPATSYPHPWTSTGMPRVRRRWTWNSAKSWNSYPTVRPNADELGDVPNSNCYNSTSFHSSMRFQTNFEPFLEARWSTPLKERKSQGGRRATAPIRSSCRSGTTAIPRYSPAYSPNRGSLRHRLLPVNSVDRRWRVINDPRHREGSFIRVLSVSSNLI